MGKQYKAEFTPESVNDLEKLDKQNQKRAIRSIRLFEELGQEAGISRPLFDKLFEIKCDKVRIYFSYYKDLIIIIGLIVLKKTQKAPPQYRKQAINRIEKYLQERQDNETNYNQ